MDDTQLDNVIAGYLDAERSGRAPGPQALLRTFPHLATQLHSFLADRDRFRRMAATLPPVPYVCLDAGQFAAIRPQRIGAYEVLGELGRGGMGVVYKARQTNLRRLVALKMVLNGGYRGPDEFARFQAEAEAVARLQHPNIVQVHEIGTHQGQPFFSLEYVDGGSLAQRIAGRPQPTRQAAALTETLARAMDYAHGRDIVHRDLKPANVLLTAQGMPKITDFGLAKRLGEDGATRTGAILGTPSYIAPEQAKGQKDVGPPADIYALGAILYELLTGRPPYRGETPLDTMLQVLEGKLVSPSQRNRRVPRDLEIICLKCLEKEPAKRYPSAAALADDLRHFLTGESIEARPARGAERFWRWCRRRPLVSGLLAAMLLLAGAGVTSVTWQWRRAEANLRQAQENFAEADRQRQRAESLIGVAEQERKNAEHERRNTEQERKNADASAQLARKAVNEWFVLITDSKLFNHVSLKPLRKELLQKALAYYQDFIRTERKNSAVRRELAGVYRRVGIITSEIGSKTDALAAFRESRTLYDELLRNRSADRELRTDAAYADLAMARTEKALGRSGDALASYQRAESALQKLQKEDPGALPVQNHLFFIYSDLGTLYGEAGRPEDALASHERARAVLEAMPPSDVNRQKLVGCLINLAQANLGLKRLSTAASSADRALALAEQLNRDAPQDPGVRWVLGRVHNIRGHLALGTAQQAQALTEFGKARDIGQKLLDQNPAVTAFQNDLTDCLHNIGAIHLRQDEPGKAVPALERCRELRDKLVQDNPAVPAYRVNLAETHAALAQAQVKLGHKVDAIRNYEKALALWDNLLRAYPATAQYKNSRDATARDLVIVRRAG
jgi:eukaryotic-like serine/threonine-protein kinase